MVGRGQKARERCVRFWGRRGRRERSCDQEMFGAGSEKERCVMEWNPGREGDGGKLASQTSGIVLLEVASEIVVAGRGCGVKNGFSSLRGRERPMEVERSRRVRPEAPVASSRSYSSKNSVSRPARSMAQELCKAT